MTFTVAELRVLETGHVRGDKTWTHKLRCSGPGGWRGWNPSAATFFWLDGLWVPQSLIRITETVADAMLFGWRESYQETRTWYPASSVGDGPPERETSTIVVSVKGVRIYHRREFEEYKLQKSLNRIS